MQAGAARCTLNEKQYFFSSLTAKIGRSSCCYYTWMTACTFLLTSPQHHISLLSNQKHSNQPYKVLQPDFLLLLEFRSLRHPETLRLGLHQVTKPPYVVSLSLLWECIVFFGSELPLQGVVGTCCYHYPGCCQRVGTPSGSKQGTLIAMDPY